MINTSKNSKKLTKPIPIIEHQEHIQRNTKEALESVLDMADRVDRIFIWHEIDGEAFYTPGSKSRNMTNADIYWLLSKLRLHFEENL